MKRNRRAGVEDRWNKTIRQPDGTTITVPSANHGTGSRWRARYVDDNGREHAKTFRRKADAQQWLNQQISDQVTGTWIDPALGNVTFGALATKWLLTKSHRAAKTVAGYESLLDTIVLPRWKDTALADIRFDDLQVWVSSLSIDGSARFQGNGLSASRTRQAHQLVGAVLKFAVRANHIKVNPASEIELPPLVETTQRYLTHKQLHQLALASGRFRTLILVLGYCGLRFGEAAALRVDNVNFGNRRIRISQSVTRVTGRGMVEGPTKNRTTRSVPIPKFLVPFLVTELKGKGENNLVFPSRRRGHLPLGELRWAFDSAVRAVQVATNGQRELEIVQNGEATTTEFPTVTPHSLRHTTASLAIAQGANIKVLQALMGHKTATLTLDRYGHLFPDDLGQIADAFDTAVDSIADDLRTIALLQPTSAGADGL